jgi:alkylation response protein AidB-like acyl-CoA dehydrogenase
MTTATGSSILRGAEWLLKPTAPDDVFTPERMTNEHRLIAQTASDFVAKEVIPALAGLEQKDWALARTLMRRAGELGLLGVDASEVYGGVALDKISSMIVSENLAGAASFGATFGAQTNLTIIPICLFGSDAQKQRYLPKLITGEIIGAYGLSEAGSGSDALGARTKAQRQPDGSFILSGEKMWITNGGFADLFVVFAKVDGELFTAFLVERSAGVKSGHEEHKMGLHGSSTTALIFEEVPIPADSVLGEIGKGHRVAFNVLNFARFKLGAACEGGAHPAIAESARYAAARHQFGQPIASFGAIKQKLGEMVVRTYAIESLLYRIAGQVDRRIASIPHDDRDAAPATAAFEEYAIEASIAKVAGSEALNFILDENIQIHGGNGYVRDYPAERHFRDARVNRIFEGTNEINRLLIPGMLAKRAMKNELPFIDAAKALRDELLGPASAPDAGDGPLVDELRAVESLKKIAVVILGTAMETFGPKLSDEQEVLMYTADILMDVFASESAVLRAIAAATGETSRAQLHASAARVFVSDASMRVDAAARQALAAIADGDSLRTLLAGLRRLSKSVPVNTTRLRRGIADETVRRGGYPFDV